MSDWEKSEGKRRNSDRESAILFPGNWRCAPIWWSVKLHFYTTYLERLSHRVFYGGSNNIGIAVKKV